MKIYYLMSIFGQLQQSGNVEIIKYHQVPGGWHIVLKDLKDNGQLYELNVIPRQKDEVEFKSFMLN